MTEDLATTEIVVRPDAVIAPVREQVFGTNVEWIRNANDLWDPKRGEIDQEILAMGRSAGIAGIRFPGGVWSDAYTWTDGVGPVANRPKTPHVPGDKEQSQHVIGTDEIAAIARDWGAKLILTVNVGNGEPEDAGAWAAYVRDTHGADLVDFWEIGNELYMKGDLSGGFMEPEAYAEKVRAFAAAIRAEIPDARISAIGLVNRGRYNFNAHRDWNEVVLRETADIIDLYAVHNAYAPIVVTERMREGARVYQAMMAAPDLIAENLRETRTTMDKAGAGNVEIAITEWGPMFTIDPRNAYFDHVKTLGSAVFVARTLNTFLRDPAVVSAQFFKLSDVLNSGWIGRDGAGGHRATPALLAFGLYADALAGSVVEIDRLGPSFRVRSTGYVGSVDDAAVVDALAT
ncbi:MAG: alpha-L-arabinofuranosidase, partial [Planctomycetota bacterium]